MHLGRITNKYIYFKVKKGQEPHMEMSKRASSYFDMSPMCLTWGHACYYQLNSCFPVTFLSSCWKGEGHSFLDDSHISSPASLQQQQCKRLQQRPHGFWHHTSMCFMWMICWLTLSLSRPLSPFQPLALVVFFSLSLSLFICLGVIYQPGVRQRRE